MICEVKGGREQAKNKNEPKGGPNYASAPATNPHWNQSSLICSVRNRTFFAVNTAS